MYTATTTSYPHRGMRMLADAKTQTVSPSRSVAHSERLKDRRCCA